MRRFNFLLLNSFDRSGSSFCAGLLSKHPSIEALFQPTNSSVFRRKIFEYWPPELNNEDAQEGIILFESILSGNFDPDIIKSRWFFSKSSSLTPEEGKLHVIKTTNLHFKIAWIKQNFPGLPVWALLRNPVDILKSLVFNGFHKEWYAGWAYNEICRFVETASFLTSGEKRFLTGLTDEIEQMSLIIAVCNKVMLENVHQENVLKYEEIVQDPNKELSKISDLIDFSLIDFKPFINIDFNITGTKIVDDKKSEILTVNETQKAISIFRIFGGLGYSF